MSATPPSLLGLTTYLLSQTGKTARSRLAARLAERDLKLWHMAVLSALVDFGPHVQRELASRLGIDRSDMVKIVDDLAVADLVDRARDTTDRRRVTVTPTPAGCAMLAELQGEALVVQKKLLAPLSRSEQTQLAMLLRRVHAHVQEEPGEPQAGR
ncbi:MULTISPECIES: MarR family winged helix-turn-helix transcriptional regulator [unclassified Streptomyces]|uniref:MarR family winged helix-turn-helix transcriptional regulator n=1 Tax=unclassified Streptomyces TaxID=2593676 RepID=UPI00225A3A8C|nr:MULTISPECIES: MarR family winged helix-turn-helix transcriptional regulator [unclassified Streptomyces]WSP59681.1 MarR family winged helix-turn-helix transcriptional regulator [Streptomyces sp. NBC_01241]WSU19800.1 MarR family winged helix-turn-helix transcriptional regulator [Streptomyces sp. NBC_01108]MCX4791492.1 MarR family winged helix-turn-helix transcriptional regulator [Streptomyces sp. NBC_01221]MCX4792803.1 MarR family winged helix-turn-helix transcriptional regulator [Streptomyces